MVAAMVHRGPDGMGIEDLGVAALGHRRLAILDLSAAGAQPMSAADGQVWITYNGEVYNYRELRQGLEAKGVRFHSQTDTEVLLQLYLDKGPDFVTELRGMFAFGLWDARHRRLLLARDRFGQKPLFYRDDDDCFRFASEAMALHTRLPRPVRMDPATLRKYLALGYVPGPRSAFLGCSKLPPAHILIKDWQQAPKLHRYWQPQALPKWPAETLKQRHQLERQGLALIDEAVRLRTLSDVPLGAFLSGGLDSSAIVSSMTAQGYPTRSFSIGFTNKSYDESAYAREVARWTQTQHFERIVETHAAEALTRLTRHFGEPFADSSALACDALAQMTRQHVTVALSGDGGDEVFGGYMRYVAEDFARMLDSGRWLSRSLLKPLVDALPVRTGRDDVFFRLKRFMGPLFERDRDWRALKWVLVFDSESLTKLATPEFLKSCEPSRVFDEVLAPLSGLSDEANVDRAMLRDLQSYLPDDLLVKVDITSMAHSLEARAPFLDHKLVEWALRLPVSEKVAWGQTKRWLKRALRRRLPAAIRHRAKKGFALPLGEWLRGPLKTFVKDLLLSPRFEARGFVRRPALEALIREHELSQGNHQHKLWALLSLELWCRCCEDHVPEFIGAL